MYISNIDAISLPADCSVCELLSSHLTADLTLKSSDVSRFRSLLSVLQLRTATTAVSMATLRCFWFIVSKRRINFKTRLLINKSSYKIKPTPFFTSVFDSPKLFFGLSLYFPVLSHLFDDRSLRHHQYSRCRL